MQADRAITWIVSSESPGKLRIAKQLAEEKTSPDATFTDVARAFPNGVEKQIVREFRLGDCFREIQVISDQSESSRSFRMVFHVKQSADRFWKDLMASILRSIRESGVSIKADS